MDVVTASHAADGWGRQKKVSGRRRNHRKGVKQKYELSTVAVADWLITMARAIGWWLGVTVGYS